ncbi:MAG: hypothetical protein LBS21_05440 [Clostridiales bacterium]|jgi:hypothetical protein|nr:hypothetical protein [Clostridiales bacterium]
MSKMIGLSRPIKREWLDKTFEIVSQSENEREIIKKLSEFLAFEIKSSTNLGKTRGILLRIWLHSSAASSNIYSAAVTAFKGNETNKLAVNWAMIALSYPVFYDMCDLIGKISIVQDTFTTSWIKEKLLSMWGERSTLYHSIDKILQTLKSFGAIESVKTGTYKIRKFQITDSDTVKVMLMVLLALNKKAYYEVPELSALPLYFPFEYNITLEWLHNTQELRLGNFGGKIVVAAEV